MSPPPTYLQTHTHTHSHMELHLTERQNGISGNIILCACCYIFTVPVPTVSPQRLIAYAVNLPLVLWHCIPIG